MRIPLEDIRWSRPEHLFDESLRACAFGCLFFCWTFLMITSFHSVQLIRILIVVDIFAASSVAMWTYAHFKMHTFIADVPKGSRFVRGCLLTVLYISPINWFIFIVSWWRMGDYRIAWQIWQQELQDHEARVLEYSNWSPEPLVPDIDEMRENVINHGDELGLVDSLRDRLTTISTGEYRTDISSLPNYPSSPNAGKAAYIQTVEAHDIGMVREKRDKLEKELEEARNEIGKLQKVLNENRVSIAEYDEILGKYKEQSDENQIASQFQKLMELPGVLAVQVVNGKFRLFVRCQATVDGRQYDLGDWRISVKPGSYKLKTKLIRDGRRPDANRRTDPPHINDDDTFCFGGNEEELKDLLKRGQLFAALTCAMSYMCQTLPGREYLIPEVFKELKS